ncbi:UNVERIFIED_ORG: O-antigen ligase [Shinella zoogloeoides]|nr:O-antigen ligase [Shinella zoogloeoides]
MQLSDNKAISADQPSRFSAIDFALYAYFTICMIPLNYGTFSVNYLFLLYPLWCLVSGRHFRMPPRSLMLMLGWYMLIFLAGAAIDITSGVFNYRSFISFVLFISVFSLMFFNVSARELRLFKYALVTCALMYSLVAVLHFYWAGGNTVGFSQKVIVGSQRYGFIYIMAFFIVMGRRSLPRLTPPVKIAVVTCLMAGMLLTFSRSTVIAFTAVVGIYTIVTLGRHRYVWMENSRDLARRYGLVLTALAALFIVMPLPFQFYNQHILARYITLYNYTIDSAANDSNDASDSAGGSNYVNDSAGGGSSSPSAIKEKDIAVVKDVLNTAGSEGTRITLWSLIFRHVNENPVLGSHYLGIWTLPGAPSGSAHNQLMDVLLRTGWPGLAIYVVLLARLLVYLFNNDRGLFWGLLATVVFGTFHETFKETQGAFILAFLISLLSTKLLAHSGHPRA